MTMQKLTIMSFVVALSLVSASCFESGSEESAPPAVQAPPKGVAADGLTYYQTNCASCHKVGQDDPTSAFGASDLAQKHDMIATNMSNYDSVSTFNLMTSFNNIPAQRVADLKAYLVSVPKT